MTCLLAGYYVPVIFLGSLLIILTFLVFLYWLAQYWLDNQEKANEDDTLDSDDSEFESPFQRYIMRRRNKLMMKMAHKKALGIEAKHLNAAQMELLKAPSESSSVSDRSGKIRSRNRLAVSLSVKHSEVYMLLSGMIKGVTGLQSPDHGGPDRIRFKLNRDPKRRKKSFKTPYHIPLDSSLIIPFQLRPVSKKELSNTVIHLRLFGKKERLGLLFGPEHCYGEAFISLANLAGDVNEINIVQEIIPLGGKAFSRQPMKIRVGSPKITTKAYEKQQIDVSPEEILIHFSDGSNRAVSTSDDNASVSSNKNSAGKSDEKRDRSHSYLVKDEADLAKES